MKISIFLFFFLITCSSAQETLKPLRMGMDNWPPYEYVENNVPSGLAYQITKAVVDLLHWPIESVEAYPWKRAQTMVYHGDLDILLSASPSEERKQNCWLPNEPLIISSWVMMARKDRAINELQYRDYQSTKGHVVGLVRGYSYTKEFWDSVDTLGNADIVHDELTNFRKLKVGRVDYLATELAVGLESAKKVPVEVHAYTENPIKSTGLYVLFSKKTVSREMAERFSQELKHFKQSAEYDSLLKSYGLKK